VFRLLFGIVTQLCHLALLRVHKLFAKYQTLLFISVVLLCPTIGGAAVTYSDSAHGDTGAGVDRTSLPSAYSIGNCGHCHEQHTSFAGNEPNPTGGPDEFLLLADTDTAATATYSVGDNGCFQCHSDTTYQDGGITNYDYSGTFAGFTGSSGTGGVSPDDIMEAFNENHSHDLDHIYDYVEGNGTYSRPTDFTFFTANSNPCTACHNPHLAKRNKSSINNRTLTVMSMPDDHESLYGWDTDESAADWNSGLMASPSYIAPTGEPTGANTPDYNSFCLYCHQYEVPSVLHTRHLDGATVSYYEPIDWTTDGSPDGDGNQTGIYDPPGDKHGVNNATSTAATDAPFNGAADVALSCMNCHEAHGSENDYMHRRSINGTALGVVIAGTTNERGNHCLPCHTEDAGGNKWKDTHHGGTGALAANDNPYKAQQLDRDGDGSNDGCDYCHGASSQASPDFPIPCEDCHFHGSYVDENDKYVDPSVKYIKPDKAPYRRKTF